MKKITFFIFLLVISISCSSDNSDSQASNIPFIIGKWKVTQRIIDGEEAELSECTEITIHEFKSDFTMKSYIDTQVTGSVACGIHEFLYKWEKISDSHFISKHIGSNNILANYYKENNKLKVVYSSENVAYYTRIL